jgi:hypothetical protein
LERAPHFLQVGDAPIFVGDGTDDLACRCGASVLVRGLRPGVLLAIDLECAACGAIATTPGLGADQVVPFGVHTADRNRMTVAQPITLPPGVTLGDRDELVRVDRMSAPRDVPAAPFEMSDATLSAAAAEYDRLSGGQLAAHRRAVPPNIGHPTGDPNTGDAVRGLARLPVAWALGQLAPGVATEGWKCLAEEPDAVAAVQLGAFREFAQVWSQHPLFPAMAASAAATGFSTHSLAVFAAARSMVKDGNRIGFAPPGGGIAVTPPGGGGRIDGFYIETSPTERMPVHVRRFDGFDWPRGSAANAAATRAAAIDALIATQGRINARQPGFLVLSVGAVHRQVDQALVDGMNQTMGERGRRHRGLAGVMLLLPKIVPTARPDQVVFSWMFLPFANPHFSYGKVALGMSRDAAMRSSPFG